MRKAIIDELKTVEDMIVSGGLIDNSLKKTSSLLAKYHFNLGKTRSQVKSEIDTYLKNNCKKYNSVTFDDSLEGIVNKASNRNNKMIYVEKIEITNIEMDKIESLPSEPLRRLAFVILYMAKLNKAKYGKEEVWLSDKVSYLCKVARVYGKFDDKMIKLSKLQDFGYVKATHSVKNFSFKVLFLDDCNDSDIVITVTGEQSSDKQIILHYKKYMGIDVIDCEKCGSLVELKSNRIKYCADCARVAEIEKYRRYNAKR